MPLRTLLFSLGTPSLSVDSTGNSIAESVLLFVEQLLSALLNEDIVLAVRRCMHKDRRVWMMSLPIIPRCTPSSSVWTWQSPLFPSEKACTKKWQLINKRSLTVTQDRFEWLKCWRMFRHNNVSQYLFFVIWRHNYLVLVLIDLSSVYCVWLDSGTYKLTSVYDRSLGDNIACLEAKPWSHLGHLKNSTPFPGLFFRVARNSDRSSTSGTGGL